MFKLTYGPEKMKCKVTYLVFMHIVQMQNIIVYFVDSMFTLNYLVHTYIRICCVDNCVLYVTTSGEKHSIHLIECSLIFLLV